MDPKLILYLKELFLSLLRKTGRKGIDKLIDRLLKSDFFTAPASTRFHLSVEGGLLQHSINVYYALKDLLRDNGDGTYSYVVAGQVAATITESTLITISLLHDYCKIHLYKKNKRNRKNEQGRWEEYDYYDLDERYPLGHGEKSVIMLLQFLRLSAEEIFAIRYHMGFDANTNANSFGAAVEKYPIIWALHTADMLASRVMEATESNRPAYLPTLEEIEAQEKKSA